MADQMRDLETVARQKLLDIADRLIGEGKLIEASVACRAVLGGADDRATLTDRLTTAEDPVNPTAQRDPPPTAESVPQDAVARLPTSDELMWWIVIYEGVHQRGVSLRTLAKHISVTHATVSNRIRTLEQKLGQPLYNRDTRQSTEFGKRVYEWAKRCQTVIASGYVLLKQE